MWTLEKDHPDALKSKLCAEVDVRAVNPETTGSTEHVNSSVL